MILAVVGGLVIATSAVLVVKMKRVNPESLGGYPELAVSSPSFQDGVIPVDYTGDGADKSPRLAFGDLSEEAVSIAVIMDDLDVPVMGRYNHWTIWNIFPCSAIAEGVPHGNPVVELGNAVQGTGYGRHRYRGPKPPFGSHRYQFQVFVLDRMLDLEPECGKKELTAAMEGHILQYGSVIGTYPA